MPEESQPGLIILKGGIIVNHDSTYKADILIENGIVKQIGTDLTFPDGARVIDVSEQYLFPGGVDLDCHIDIPNDENPLADSFLSASRTAVLGGTTTVVTTLEVKHDCTPLNCFEQFIVLSKGGFTTDYSVCIKLTQFNQQIADEMTNLIKNKGVAVFAAQIEGDDSCDELNKRNSLNEQEFCEFLKTCRSNGAIPLLNAESSTILKNRLLNETQIACPDIGPEIHALASKESAEANTILRASLFAFCAGFSCPLLISRLHSESALKHFVEQRRLWRGLLFGQTTVSAIGAPFASTEFTESKDWAIAASYVNSPPLRPDMVLSRKLLSHLTSGDLMSVGSGHRAITTLMRAKLGLKHPQNIPSAVAALGYRLIVLWHCGVETESFLDPCLFVKVVSSDPARLANLYPQKGRIAIGSDADIVVWNKGSYNMSAISSQLLPQGVPNIFSSIQCKSGPQLVILRGRVVVENQQLCEDVDSNGKFLPLKPFAQYTYGRISNTERHIKSELETITRDPYMGKVITSKTPLEDSSTENYYFRKEHYDNVPKVALPPGQRKVHTSVKTVQPPGGASNVFWMNE